MTDKEKLLHIINILSDDTDLETILFTYLDYNFKSFSTKRLKDLIDFLNNNYLNTKIKLLENASLVAYERATYLKRYLDGSMWKDEESAKYNIRPQIENAQAIIDACTNQLLCEEYYAD